MLIHLQRERRGRGEHTSMMPRLWTSSSCTLLQTIPMVLVCWRYFNKKAFKSKSGYNKVSPAMIKTRGDRKEGKEANTVGVTDLLFLGLQNQVDVRNGTKTSVVGHGLVVDDVLKGERVLFAPFLELVVAREVRGRRTDTYNNPLVMIKMFLTTSMSFSLSTQKSISGLSLMGNNGLGMP